jgi:hypothetical protein
MNARTITRLALAGHILGGSISIPLGQLPGLVLIVEPKGDTIFSGYL